MSKRQKKKKKFSDYLLTLALIAAVGIFAFAAYKLYSIYAEYKAGEEEYDKIKELAVSENPNQAVEEELPGEPEGAPKPPITVDFAQLKAINPDVVGWIYLEGLEVSYPVVQGEDNEHYLSHTYEGNYNIAGSIFVEMLNKEDFSDCNTIVYGHNMKNGSMFGTLKQYTEQDAYAKSPYFWILTPKGNYRYEIFSAYVSPVNSDTYTLFKGPGEEFLTYMQEMKGNTEVATREIEMDKQDKVVTLSTCTGNEATRYVVQGIRIK